MTGVQACALPICDRLDRMFRMGKRWARLEEKRRVLAEGISRLDEFEVIDQVEQGAGLNECLAKLEGLLQRRKTLLQSIKQAETKLKAVQEKLDSMVGESCVTCGQALTKEHAHG